MKNNGFFFRFGGISFALYGAKPLTNAESLLPPFMVAPVAQPDITIYAEKSEALALPHPARLLHEAYGLRVFETETERFLCYRDTDKAQQREYAIVRCRKAEPDVLYFTLSETRYRFSAERLLSSLAVESLLLRHSRGILHAACIAYEGQAILFSGACGCGKSTQAALWEKHVGTTVCNGDKVLLWNTAEGLLACGLPFAGSSNICKDFRLPVTAIVFPEHAAENTLIRLSPLAASKRVLSQLPVQAWSREDVENALALAVHIAKSVPCYSLACRPEQAAVDCLKTVL